MKKTLLILLTVVSFGSVKAQNLFSFGFDGTTAAMITAGWQVTNQSSPVYTGAPTWSIANYTAPTATTPFGGLMPVGQDGALNSFALINYTSTGTSSTAGSGTISNWLITPTITVQNGDVVSFYTRTGADVTAYADRLQLRMSTTGDASTNPTGGATGLGSFTTLLTDVNPNLNLTDYPNTWDTGLETVTISGLSGPTPVKFGFRYFVTNGGPTGANSDIIGIDTFSVDRPLSTGDFFSHNFAISPNPVKTSFNLTTKNGATAENVKVIDMNGRIVNNTNVSDMENIEVNVADLSAGVYFVKVQSQSGIGTSKIIKQ